MCVPFSINNKVTNTSATADVNLPTLLINMKRVAALIVTTKVWYVHTFLPFYSIEELVDQNMAHRFFSFEINTFVATLSGIYAFPSWNNASEVLGDDFLRSLKKKVFNEFFTVHFIIIIYFSFMRHTLYRETLLLRMFVPPLIGNFQREHG